MTNIQQWLFSKASPTNIPNFDVSPYLPDKKVNLSITAIKTQVTMYLRVCTHIVFQS